MNIDWGVIKLVLLGVMGLSAITMMLLGFLMVRRKISKEIGYLIRHLRYHPARPVRKLHFEDYGAVHQDQPEQPAE